MKFGLNFKTFWIKIQMGKLKKKIRQESRITFVLSTQK